jgi:hypothetical protein
MTILANNAQVWAGLPPSVNDEPSKIVFDVPAHVLRDGQNVLSLRASKASATGYAMALTRLRRLRGDDR